MNFFMNILFITDNFYPEGNAIASRVYERACYWVKWGHPVTVITSAPNFPEGKLYPGYKNKWFHKEIIQGITVIRVKTLIQSNKGFLLRILDFLSFMMPAFLAGLFQKKPDVIITTSPQFFGAITACLLSRCKQVPFILELGDLWPASIVGVGAMRDSLIIRILEKIELLLYRWSDKIIVVSPAFKDNLISRKVNSNKIDTIMNGVDLSKFMPKPRNALLSTKYGISENMFVVGYIGTQGMAHALENVLQAASNLLIEKNILFILVGTGAEKELLLATATKLQLTNVLFIPAQPKEIIPDYWSLCTVALVHFKNTPIFSVSIPSKIFEAMGMGLPILLASPKGIASDIVINENVGLWVPAEDATVLSNTILHLYKNADLVDRLAKQSLSASKFHTREAQARLFLESISS